MELLALLTLNLLLLISFTKSTSYVNRDRIINTKKGTVQDTRVQKPFEISSQKDVLGSYIISFDAITSSDAITKNLPPEEQKDESESDKETPKDAMTDTPEAASLTPTPEPDNEPVKVEIETPDSATLLINKINSYRQENGLPSFSYNQVVCNFATTRTRELQTDFSHSGFRSRIDSGTLPYQDYSHIAENIADTDAPERAFDLWRNSPGHNENMLSSATYGCIGNTGRLYTLEVWSP